MTLAAALALSALGSRWLSRRGDMVDHPNERSLHQTPVPRNGGIAVVIGFTVPLAALALLGYTDPALAWIAAATLLVAGVSLWDDLVDVPVRIRLAIHCLGVVLLIIGGLRWSALDLPALDWSFPPALSWPLTLLFGVWMINLYNFMDGMDGFAGGMAAIGFGALAVLGWRGGDPIYSLSGAAIAVSAAGFLTSNFPPARIFLGDVGSSTLGLLAAALSLWGNGRGLFPLWVAWLVFSPFIVDATWTLFGRLLAGERIWQAHRNHHYQRLVLAGWGHRRTVLRAYLVMIGAALCAVAAPGLAPNEQWTLILAWVAIYLLIHWRVGIAERIAEKRLP